VTPRGRSVLLLGVVIYAVAWAFGSRPLYPVAAGLVLVSVLAWAWLRLAHRPFEVHRKWGQREYVEGDDVFVSVELESAGSVTPPSAVLVERVGRLGERRGALTRAGNRLRVKYVLPALPRGRYAFEDVHAELSDPFGLQRVIVPLPAPGALLVYPQLVRLERLFPEAGAHALEGRRLLLHRPTGFDLHSVREHEQGESLRNVHWRSTARRGQLMVKELEDAPRDEVAVVLDASADAVAGESFDVQVRAAGSILDAYVRRGRRAVLVVAGVRGRSQQVHSPTGDRQRALELLAAVEPLGRTPLTVLLAEEATPAARALELVVVTARIEPALVDRLIQRALSHRKVSLVYVEAPTFAGSGPKPQPQLLRLQGAGVPVAVVRAGDDLAARLAGEPDAGVAAHA
jgi:uncharacterized protein (DUF58 family)